MPEGRTGMDTLRATGLQVRLDGGFVCAIDGYPETGCGTDSNFTGSYWRYWHAPPGGAWTYSRVGAGGFRLPARCGVQGWVWSSSPTENPAPSRPAPTLACDLPPATTPTTARPTPTTAPPPQPGPGPGVAPAVPGPPSSGAGPGAVPAGPGAGPGVAAGAPGAATGADLPAGQPSVGDTPEQTVPAEVLAEQGEPAEADEGTAPDAGDPATEPRDSDARADEVAAAATPDRRSGGSPLGVLLAVALVGALGAGAFVVQKRRGEGDSGDPAGNA